jgi:hypothetical protein
MQANTIFKIAAWDEQPMFEEGGYKLTRATVRKTYSGDLEGEGVVEFLMAYRPDGTARFIGFERVTGHLGGRAGSFMLEHRGDFEGGLARTAASIVPGSGTGALQALRGEMNFAAGHEEEHPVTLDYETDS